MYDIIYWYALNALEPVLIVIVVTLLCLLIIVVYYEGGSWAIPLSLYDLYHQPMEE